MTENDTSQILRDAAEIVARGWCQGAWAQDKNDESVAPCSDDAVKWCAIGALILAVRSQPCPDIAGALTALGRAIRMASASQWNDNPKRTQAQVVNALRRAARLA